MKKIGLAGLGVGIGILCLAGCGRARELPVAESAERSAPSSSPYVTEVGEIKIEYRPVAIPSRIAPNSRAEIQFEARNVGAKIWPVGGANPLRFGYHWEVLRGDGTWDRVVWDDGNRAMLKSDVKPGEAVVVTLPVKALPKSCPTCRLVIAPLLELKAWSESARYIAPVNVS
jgi:hypothetical protein